MSLVTRDLKNERRHNSDMRISYSLYGPLMRDDINKILERKNSRPRNFKLRISSDPDEFIKKPEKKNIVYKRKK
jgi:hypothetical protein